MFDKKYVYVNKQEYQVSYKQVSGTLQLNELKVSAENTKVLEQKSIEALSVVFGVCNHFNETLEKEKREKADRITFKAGKKPVSKDKKKMDGQKDIKTINPILVEVES